VCIGLQLTAFIDPCSLLRFVHSYICLRGSGMKAYWITAITALLINVGCSFAAASPHQWKSGTLLESEKQQVLESSTETSNTDGSIKDRKNGKKADYSENSTTTRSNNYDNFQVYTIQGEKKTDIARNGCFSRGRNRPTLP